MSATTLDGLKESLSAFWGERNAREKNVLLAAAAVIVLAVIYLLLIEPALSGRAQLERNLPQLRQQAAELQSLAKQATVAGRDTTPPPAPVTKESIDTSLERRGLKSQNTLVSGELVKVQLNSASFAGIVGWLEEMKTSARLSVTEASIETLAAIDTVNATLTLQQQRNDK